MGCTSSTVAPEEEATAFVDPAILDSPADEAVDVTATAAHAPMTAEAPAEAPPVKPDLPPPIPQSPPPPPLLPPPPPPMPDETLKAYTELPSLRDLVRSGDIAFLRASYLLRLASAAGGRSGRSRGGGRAREHGIQGLSNGWLRSRQELAEDAFASAALLERSLAELTAWDAYLTSPHQSSHATLCRFPPFVIVSHSWGHGMYTQEEEGGEKEPAEREGRGGSGDGDRRTDSTVVTQLCCVLAPAIEWYMCERAKLIRDGGAHGAPHIQNPPDVLHGCDFCVFICRCSLYQHSSEAHQCESCRRCRDHDVAEERAVWPCERHRRSAAQEEAYQRATASMGILYAHSHTCVWRLSSRASEDEHSDPLRAWPFFEAEVSRLIKFAPNLLDLGTASAASALAGFNGRMARSMEELVARASYSHSHKAGVHRRLQDSSSSSSTTRAPLTPEAFAEAVGSKPLAFPSERDILIDMYNKVYGAVIVRAAGDEQQGSAFKKRMSMQSTTSTPAPGCTKKTTTTHEPKSWKRVAMQPQYEVKGSRMQPTIKRERVVVMKVSERAGCT